ncbi:MAG: Nudix family hydrolase [Motiliproteus sp.]
MKQSIHVAAAAIFGDDGRLLITRRSDHTHQGGLWEFPGGKVEAGESVQQALCRELKEELDIEPRHYLPLIRIPFSYPDKTVLLDVWRVLSFDGEPKGLEGQPMRWLSVSELDRDEFPAANRAIIDSLQLPDRYLITGDYFEPEDFLKRLQRALDAGVAMVQFRHKTPRIGPMKLLLDKAVALCHAHKALLLVNGDFELAEEVGADGVHLSSTQLMSLNRQQLQQWRQRWPQAWIGASCHNEQELQKAAYIGVRYVSLSPVMATASHPETEAMGWQRFQQLVDKVPLPVFALGGMELDALDQVMQSGGQGIAAIREFWGS